jgi:tyrosine-protein kinase
MQAQMTDDQTTESIDIVKYLVLLWHWSWLIILVVIVAGCAAFFVSKLIHPVYQAQTTVLVDMAPSNKTLDYSTLQLSSQLTQTYAQMLVKSSVLSEVSDRLGIIRIDPKVITAKPVANTQLINILVESTDPKLAADIANVVVAVFADQVQSLQTTRFSASEESLLSQMADIESKIKTANDQLATTTDPTEKDRLEAMVANYSQTYSSLLQSYEQVRIAEAQTRSSIVPIEPAEIPIDPVRPRTLVNVGVAVLISAVLICGLIIGVDLLNDTIKTPDDISNKLGLPVLGVISHYKNTETLPITESQPLSPVAEAFRTLRTNVQYAGAGLEQPMRSIMVISAMPSEGKSSVIINLGVVLAQKGLRVLLVDADLRRPTLHRRLELENYSGLSQVFVQPELGMEESLQSTQIKGLSVLTAGDTPPNPSELLGSQLMYSIMEELKNHYDIVLIDTPPALAVTDAAAMLPFIEGVVLVIRPGTTHLAPLRRLVDQFHQLNAHLLGAVLNNINLHSSSYGYYYKHYKYYNEYREVDGNQKARRKDERRSDQMIWMRPTTNPLRQVAKSVTSRLKNE